MKSYIKYFLILVLSFAYASLSSIEPQELLGQWKAMAEQERLQQIDYCKVKFEDKTVRPDLRGYYKQDYDNWLKRVRLDHIKICYNENCEIKSYRLNKIVPVVIERKIYIQLERSRTLSGWNIYARFFDYHQEKVDQIITDLMSKLPLDKTPKVTAQLSRKKRLKPQLGLFEKDVDDLYSVIIDYR